MTSFTGKVIPTCLIGEFEGFSNNTRPSLSVVGVKCLPDRVRSSQGGISPISDKQLALPDVFMSLKGAYYKIACSMKSASRRLRYGGSQAPPPTPSWPQVFRATFGTAHT
jgi:hypothetical protein